MKDMTGACVCDV